MPGNRARWNHYDPAEARRAKNIGHQVWEQFRREITLLHNAGCTKQAILNALAKDECAIEYNFCPTVHQLVRQMGIWRLRDDQRHLRKQGRKGSGPAGQLHSDDGPVVTGPGSTVAVTSQPHFPHRLVRFPEPPLPNYNIGDANNTVRVPTPCEVAKPVSCQLRGTVLAPNASMVSNAHLSGEHLMMLTESANSELQSVKQNSELSKINRKQKSADSAIDELESSIDAMTIDTRSSWRFSKVTGMPSNRSSSVPPRQGDKRPKGERHGKSNGPVEIYNFARRSVAFYEVGRVFSHLLINRSNGTDLQFDGRITLANGFHSRDFIVTRRNEDCFVSVPFHRHHPPNPSRGSHRLLNSGQEQLAVIHLEDEKPITLHEDPITALEPIAVRPVQTTRSVCQPSVINFSKPIKFHYLGLVMDLGMVSKESMTHFEQYTRNDIYIQDLAQSDEVYPEENRSFWENWLPVGVDNRSEFEFEDETCSKVRRLMASQTMDSALPVVDCGTKASGLNDFECDLLVPAQTAAPLPYDYSAHSYAQPGMPYWHENLTDYIPGSEFV